MFYLETSKFNKLGGYKIMSQKGSGYIGSPGVQISNSNHEVVPTPPSTWSNGYSFYKFSFKNTQSCRVKINNGDPIALDAGDGFEMDEIDAPIWSFVIIESGIEYKFIAAY